MPRPLFWLFLLALCEPAWAGSEAERARSLAASCAACHGTEGRAQGGMVPLAGMPAETLVRAMSEFKSGQRAATVMHQLAPGYSDEQIALIARHFAAQAARK